MKNYLYLLPIFFSSLNLAHANGGIVLDGTTGNSQAGEIISTSDGTNNVVISQDMGTTSGHNLFQSFSEFNINFGQTVTYTGDSSLLNVITRVTGSDISNINGNLVSHIPNADFYFINPNGVLFGSGASVNVPAAFHLSTANRLDFSDSSSFYVDTTQTSNLSSASPVDLGFAATSTANNALIDFNGAQLTANQNQIFDFSAGQITVENSSIITGQGGEIRLDAQQNGDTISVQTASNGNLQQPAQTASQSNAGAILISGGSQIVSNCSDTSCDSGSGPIDIDAGSLTLMDNGTSINSQTFGAGKAGDITINAGSLTLSTDGISIYSQISGNGDTGVITITGDSLSLNGYSSIYNQTSGNGNSNSIVITESGMVNMLTNSSIYTTYNGDGTTNGNAGDIKLQAGDLIMSGANIYSQSSVGQSNSGAVSVTVDNTLQIGTNSTIYSNAVYGSTGAININAGSSTSVGSITLDSSSIYNETDGTGKAGDIIINAGLLTNMGTLTNTGSLSLSNASSIYSLTTASGDAGNITFNLGSLALDASSIYNETQSTAKAGDISINAGNLTNPGTLNLNNGASIYNQTTGDGNTGVIHITLLGNLEMQTPGIDNDGNNIPNDIYTQTKGNGNAGNVIISVSGALDMAAANNIYSITSGDKTTGAQIGKAGDVSVQANSLSMNSSDNQSTVPTTIYSASNSLGAAGAVNVTVTNLLQMYADSSIYTSAKLLGNAAQQNINEGQVTVNAANLYLSGNHTENASIYSATWNQGNAGAVSVNVVADLTMQPGSFINSTALPFNDNSQTLGEAGNVSVTATNIAMFGNQNAQTFISSNTVNNNGRIVDNDLTVTASKSLSIDGGGAGLGNGNGYAGITVFGLTNESYCDAYCQSHDNFSVHDINIKAHDIKLNNVAGLGSNSSSDFIQNQLRVDSDTVELATGSVIQVFGDDSGGNANINAQFLIMNSSLFYANSKNAADGNINLNIESILSNNGNIIHASGQLNGIGQQLNLSGVLSNLGAPQFDLSPINQDYCGLSQTSSLTRVGRGGLPPTSQDLFMLNPLTSLEPVPTAVNL